MAALSANTCPPPGALCWNRDHPLSSRAFAVIPLTRSDRAVELVTGRVLVPNSVPSADRLRTRHGDAIGFGISADNELEQLIDSGFPTWPDQFTAVLVGSRYSSAKSGSVMLSTVAASGGIGLAFEQHINSGLAGFTIWGSADYTFPSALAVDHSSAHVFRINGSPYVSRTSYLFREDGLFSTTNNAITLAGGLTVGGGYLYGHVLYSNSNGVISLAMIFRGLLTDGECWDLVYDPWMLFRPHRAVVGFNLTEAAIATIFRRSNTLQNRIGTRMPI